MPGRDAPRAATPVNAPPPRQDQPRQDGVRREDPPLHRPKVERPQSDRAHGERAQPTVQPQVERSEPAASPPRVEPPRGSRPPVETPPVIVTPPPPAKPLRPVFAGDRPDGHDALGIDATLGQLAELAAHKRTQTPLCIGLVGGAGTGKSFALRRLVGRIRDLAVAGGKAPDGPFVAQIHVESVDAAALEGDPALAIAGWLHAGLRRPYPELAREIAATARDPQVVLRDAEDKLDEIRRRLDAERRALEDAGSRRARLTETVLYEAAGSQVDAYARANRTGIEARLAGFGIAGDAIRNYKNLVQLAAGSGGIAGLALRSIWAFKGQSKLLVLAVVLLLAGFGLGVAIDDQAGWLGQMRGAGSAGASSADWFQSHMGLIATAKTALYGLALLALVGNVLRAFAFLQPIRKGAQLLAADIEARGRDLDGLCAHQTKRVDALEADADRLTRLVAEAERRLGGATATRHEPSPFETGGAAAHVQTFFTTLAAAMADARAGGETKVKAPQRIVLAVDQLDAVAPERARALLDALHRAAGQNLVTLVGLDPARLGQTGADQETLERWIQVPLRLDAPTSADAGDALVREALGHDRPAATPTPLDPRRSDLDVPVRDEEAALLSALSSLAGRTPRAVKRFVNLYGLARLGEERHLGALAFMLALAQGGTAAERAAVVEAFAAEPESRFDLPENERRIRAALGAVTTIAGRFSRCEAAEAARRASAFALTPLVA